MPDSIVVVGPEVDSQPELMRTLPWPRFTGLDGEQVSLPVWSAITLEGAEQALRAAGLIGPGEILTQTFEGEARFKVQVVQGELSSRRKWGKAFHSLVSFEWSKQRAEIYGDQLTPGRDCQPLPCSGNEWTTYVLDPVPVEKQGALAPQLPSSRPPCDVCVGRILSGKGRWCAHGLSCRLDL